MVDVIKDVPLTLCWGWSDFGSYLGGTSSNLSKIKKMKKEKKKTNILASQGATGMRVRSERVSNWISTSHQPYRVILLNKHTSYKSHVPFHLFARVKFVQCVSFAQTMQCYLVLCTYHDDTYCSATSVTVWPLIFIFQAGIYLKVKTTRGCYPPCTLAPQLHNTTYFIK